MIMVKTIMIMVNTNYDNDKNKYDNDKNNYGSDKIKYKNNYDHGNNKYPDHVIEFLFFLVRRPIFYAACCDHRTSSKILRYDTSSWHRGVGGSQKLPDL